MSVVGVLDGGEAEHAEVWRDESAASGVVAEGAFGEPAVDHGNGDAASSAGAEEVGPEFEFGECDGVRLNGVEESSDGERCVEGVSEDLDGWWVLMMGVFGAWVEGSGVIEPGVGGGGEDDVAVLGEFGDEGADGVDLADADGVDEDALAFSGLWRRDAAEAFAPSASGAFRPGRPGDEGEDAVDEVEDESHCRIISGAR